MTLVCIGRERFKSSSRDHLRLIERIAHRFNVRTRRVAMAGKRRVLVTLCLAALIIT